MARREKPSGRHKKRRMGMVAGLALVVLLGAYVAVVANSRPQLNGQRLRLDSFIGMIGSGRIQSATLLDQDEVVTGRYVRDDGSEGRYSVAFPPAGGHTDILALLLARGVPTEIDHQFSKRLMGPATMLLPALMMVVIFIYLLLSYQQGTGLFGVRSGARRIDAEDSPVTFADVAGQDSAVAELKEVRDFLADPGRFAAMGVSIPKGILLYGPPGCGKTLLARAVAGEAGAAFYSISGSDFVELYVGVGAARVRDLFREAREHSPSIVFIDELDSVGRRRGAGSAGGTEEQEQALNQILAEMDGFSPMDGIIVMGATNRPDVLDPALLRPGRFDRAIGLERPDEAGRLGILAVHAAAKPLSADVDLAAIARRAVGLAGADLASVMNEGGLLAARAGRAEISQVDLEQALTRILESPERQRRLSMRARSFGRSTGGGESRVGFDDVVGVDEAVAELGEVRDYLIEPERYAEMGARPPRGFLLIGPPGCGKTLLARAVATETNAAFFSVAATELVEVFAGEGAARVRDVFAEARALSPSIVFIDEIDAIGARRGTNEREREQTLNQILIELDGFEARTGVIVMAATNRPEILDEALVRPGRFDRTVVISLPDQRARNQILALHSEGKRLAVDVDLESAARLTQGLSGADLANVMNEAALLATRRRAGEISMAMVEEAVERARGGVGRSHVLSDEERAVVAHHEAGHALVGWSLPGAQAPHKVSIVARGPALGLTWNVDASDRSIYSKSALLDEMAAMLGGRAAEELIFGEAGSGAADDLRRVGQLARRMVNELGMGEAVAPLAYADRLSPEARTWDYSEQLARKLDDEMSNLVETAYERARSVLAGSRPALERTAQALLERETVNAEELAELLGRVPPPRRQAAAAAAALGRPAATRARR